MKKVLVPIDGSDNALNGVRQVVRQFFRDSNIEVHVLHVRVPFSRHVSQFVGGKARASFHQEMADAATRPAKQLLEKHSVPHAIHVGFGDPVTVIAETTKQLHINEIVMGTARKNLLVRFVQDSVSARVTEAVDVPVQLVSGKRATSWERIGVPAVVSAALAALFLAAAE